MSRLADVHFRGLTGKVGVICGDKQGILLGGRRNLDSKKGLLVRCFCDVCKNKRCISSDEGGCIYTTGKFEGHGGRGSANNWRSSFKVSGPAGNKSLNSWLEDRSAVMKVRYPVGSTLHLWDHEAYPQGRWEQVTVVGIEDGSLNSSRIKESRHSVRFSDGSVETVLLCTEQIKPSEAGAGQGAAAMAAEGGGVEEELVVEMEDGEIAVKDHEDADADDQVPGLMEDNAVEAAPEEADGDAANENGGSMEVEKGETGVAEGEQGSGGAVDAQTPQPLVPVAAPPVTTTAPAALTEAPGSDNDAEMRTDPAVPAKRSLDYDESGPSEKRAKQDAFTPESLSLNIMELLKSHDENMQLKEALEHARTAKEKAEAQVEQLLAAKEAAEARERAAKEAAQAQIVQERAEKEAAEAEQKRLQDALAAAEAKTLLDSAATQAAEGREREAKEEIKIQAEQFRKELERERASKEAAKTHAADELNARRAAEAKVSKKEAELKAAKALAKEERTVREKAEDLAAREQAARVAAETKAKKECADAKAEVRQLRNALKDAKDEAARDRDARKAAEAQVARERDVGEAAIQAELDAYQQFHDVQRMWCASINARIQPPNQEAAPDNQAAAPES